MSIFLPTYAPRGLTVLQLWILNAQTANEDIETHIYFNHKCSELQKNRIGDNIGLDSNASGSLLVVLLRAPALLQSKQELSRRAHNAGIHKDDYITL